MNNTAIMADKNIKVLDKPEKDLIKIDKSADTCDACEPMTDEELISLGWAYYYEDK